MDNKIKGDLGEAFVNKTAFSTFLKYWCFPNPRDIIKDNKEICDLLVIFADVCIIVSVKNYSFLGRYDRYFKKTINKAVRQIVGAERRLFGERTIVIRHPDRDEMIFPKTQIKTVLRVIVNTNTSVKYYPTSFTIGKGNRVTIFDADAWDALVTEMDTVTDFVKYMIHRQKVLKNRHTLMLPREEFDFTESDGAQFLESGETLKLQEDSFAIVSGSERDLIALYILSGFRFPQKLYDSEEPFLLINADGTWERYQQSRLSKSKADFEAEGYFVDSIVKELLIHEPNGDKISQALYKLDRIQRARFTREFFKFHDQQRLKTPQVHLHRANIIFDEAHFVFIYFNTLIPQIDSRVLEGFIDKSLHHRNYLMDYKCDVVIAIAFSQDLKSCAFGYIDRTTSLTDMEKREMETAYRELGWQVRESSE